MASIHFMSPRCDETSFLASLAPQTPADRQIALQRTIARRLLLELRHMINPGARWNQTEAAAVQHEPNTQCWMLFDSTGLAGAFAGGQSIPGGIVRIEATLTALGGSAATSLSPERLTIRQCPSFASKPFVTLRGAAAETELATEFDLRHADRQPLDELIARRGDYQGQSLRYLLNRYDG